MRLHFTCEFTTEIENNTYRIFLASNNPITKALLIEDIVSKGTMNGQLNNPEDININEEFVEKLHQIIKDKVRIWKQNHHYLHLH